VELRLLGPIEVRLEDRPIELGPRKQRAVLAMLALQAGRTVSADRLVEGLWGAAPPSSAPKMLQLYISHLRPLLAGSGARIVTRDGGYELQLNGDEVDVERVERLLEDSRAREALGLWRGEALADVAGEPFAAAAIRRLDELRLQATERAIDDDLAAGRHAQVIGELEALVAQQPLREHLHAQRMLALYRAGRQSEALAAYRDARSGLIEQVGLEPGSELHRLQDAILAHDPALDAPEAVATASPSARRPPPRRPAWVLITAAFLVFAALAAYGVIRVMESRGLAGIGENAVGRINPESGQIEWRSGVGKGPTAVVGGGGSVWVANAVDGTVSRIRGERDPVVTIPVDGAPAALAFGGGSLWVADSDSRKVWQVDPGANRTVDSFEVGNAPRALAFAAGALWVASGVDGRLQRIDIDRGRVGRPVLVRANPSAIAAGAGALWVASEEAGTVTRVNPRTGELVEPIQVGHGPSALAVGEGAVWVVNRHDGTLSRIDPSTNRVSWTGVVGSDPTAVAAGAGSVWVAGGEERTVRRVDPDRPAVVERLPVSDSASAIAVAGGSVWTAATAPQDAHRGGTLRVFVPRDPLGLVPMDWLDWHAYTTWATFSLSSLAYDGLVAYRRVEGAAGDTLVGALATTVPAPSPDGRTYVFTLRPGLRYSDGRPVRPADFRASIERFLDVARGLSSTETFPSHYEGIVGARRCMRSRAPCDLSRGIEADPSGRTITIHLTRPDGDFLHKLTMAFAFVVPAGSPARSTTGPPPPGTGPYRVVAWNAKRGGTLVRNRHFRSGPARSRGDGFVDRIEVAVHDMKKVEPRIAAVQRGEADLAVVADNFGSLVPEDRLRGLLTRRPGRMHSNPAANTDWIFLNVRRRPFDDIRVRQAVNFAIDRRKVVALSGGSAVGQITCQVVPAGFSGHEPYCPYTATPTKGGGWTAPDLRRARQLVAASGRAGDHVIVRVPEFREAVGRYYGRLLDDLGFRTTVRVLSFKDDDTWDADARAQTGFVGWGADYLAASTFIESMFTCAARGLLNLAQLCDRTLQRRIERAVAMPPSDAADAWATAEHRLTDLAAVVPLTRRRAVVLVSKRVGNVRYHPQWATLLDQMWVR
jgi:peptide/nickel transport system substrate-binding protein